MGRALLVLLLRAAAAARVDGDDAEGAAPGRCVPAPAARAARGYVGRGHRLGRERRPVLLLGDLDETERGGAIRALARAGFTLACDAPHASCGSTWPGQGSSWPALVRIDHALVRGLQPAIAFTPAVGVSDHDPLMLGLGGGPMTAPASR